MAQKKRVLKAASQTTFLYYKDIDQATEFFESVLGLVVVDDKGFAKVYRTAENAYVGIIDEKIGFLNVQKRSATLITLAIDDVHGWYDYLAEHGVRLLTGIQENKELSTLGFFIEGPGGYTFEFVEFTAPELKSIFHR